MGFFCIFFILNYEIYFQRRNIYVYKQLFFLFCRYILNILYIMVETSRTCDISRDASDPLSQQLLEAREMFKDELGKEISLKSTLFG